MEEEYFPYEVDQPLEEQIVSSQVNSIIRSYSSLERGGPFIENVDAIKIEDFGQPIPPRIIRDHFNNITRQHFEKHSVVAQAEILHGLIKHKKLKHATKLLGVQDAKRKKTHMNVTKNICKAFTMFGESRKPNVQVVRREITTVIVAPSTTKKQKLASMSKSLHVSRKKLA